MGEYQHPTPTYKEKVKGLHLILGISSEMKKNGEYKTTEVSIACFFV
jgi:hypothetical protein